MRIVHRNQSLILGIPEVVPRFLKLLHLNSLGSSNWTQHIVSQLSSSTPELIQAVLSRGETDDSDEDWHNMPALEVGVGGGDLRVS